MPSDLKQTADIARQLSDEAEREFLDSLVASSPIKVGDRLQDSQGRIAVVTEVIGRRHWNGEGFAETWGQVIGKDGPPIILYEGVWEPQYS